MTLALRDGQSELSAIRRCQKKEDILLRLTINGGKHLIGYDVIASSICLIFYRVEDKTSLTERNPLKSL